MSLAVNLGAEKAQLSRERNQAKKVEKQQERKLLDQITPATGEVLKDWLSRRIGIGLGKVPPQLALQNAVTPMADFELESVTKVGAMFPTPQPSGSSGGIAPQPRTAQGDDKDLIDLIGSGIKAAGRGVAKGIDFVTPEDAEDFIGNTKAFLLGGPDSSGQDSGYEGVVPSIINPVMRGGHIVGNLFVDFADGITDLTTSLTPGGSKPSEVLKKLLDPTQVDEYLKEVVSTPAGDNLAADMGFERGSLPFKVAAGSTNFFVDNVSLGFLAAPGRAAKAASRLPTGSVLVRETSDLGLVRSRAIQDTLTQYLFDRSSLSAEQLVSQRGTQLVNRLTELAPQGAGAIKGVFPSIPSAMAKEMAREPGRVSDILVAGLKGDLLPVTRREMEERLADIADEVAELRSATSVPTIGFASPTPNRLVKELEDEAAKIRNYLDGKVTSRESRVVLHELPDTSMRTDFRMLARSEGKLATAAKVLQDANWTRHLTRPIPAGGISTWDRESGVAQVRAWGELFRLPTKEVDELVTEYLDAAPGEILDFSTRLLKRGETNLPPSMARRVTQMKNETVGRPYGLNDEGEAVAWKSRGSDGVLSPQPIHSGQLADEIPMPDPRMYIEARQWGPRFDKWAEEQVAKTASLGAKGLLQTSRGVARAGMALRRAEEAFVTQFWVPAVLARLGWTVKVVGIDEHARLATVDVPGLWNHPFEFVWDRIGQAKLRQANRLLGEGRTQEAYELQQKWSNPVRGLIESAPEEVMSNFGRDMIGVTRRPDLIVRRQGFGYGQSWHDELVQMHNGKEVQYLAAHGPQETIRWLKSSPRGQETLKRLNPTLAKVEINGAKGASVEDFVANLEAHLKRLAPTDDLRQAVATGRFNLPGRGQMWIGDSRLADYLQEVAGPSTVRGSSTFFARHDPNKFKQFQGNLMRWLGSNPSNVSRSQVYGHLYDREVTSLVGRGVPQHLAESAARERVIQVTNELLYDMTQRTSFDQVHKALIPFFPAYREVLKAWGSAIPQKIGGDLGRIVAVGKLGALQGLAEDLGIYRNLVDQEDKSLGPGVELFGAQFPVKNLLFISSAPQPGPARTAMLKQIAKDVPEIRKFEEKMGWFADSSVSLGPAWLNRAYWGVFQSAPPWEKAFGSARHQQAQWDLSLNKMLKNHAAEVIEIGNRPENQRMREISDEIAELRKEGDSDERIKTLNIEYERLQGVIRGALGVVLSDARDETRTDYLARAFRGFVLPIQPLSLGNKEDQAIRDALDSLDEGAKADFYRDLQVNNPVAYLRLASTTYLTTSEVKDEKGIEAFWKQIDDGKRKVMEPEAFAKYLLGRSRYSAIRHDYAAQIARAGKTARDLALNYHLVRAANVDRDNAIDALIFESEDPDSAVYGWGKSYNDVLRIYRGNLTYKEFKLRQTARSINESLALLPEDMLSEVDVSALKGYISILYDSLGDVFEGTPPAGPQGTLAKWFDKVYGPYQDQVSDLYAKRDKALAEGGDTAAVYDEIRRARNAQAEMKIDGVAMPSPEAFSFGAKTPVEQQRQRQKWAMNSPLWLTNFQREKLGLKTDKETADFLDLANEVRIGLDKALKLESSTLKGRANDLFDSWVVGESDRRGFDFDLGTPYRRLTDYDLIRGKGWERVVQVADGFNAVLQAAERKRPNVEQQEVFNKFVQSMMTQDPELTVSMRSLWKSSHLHDKSFFDQFLPFLFFSRG